MKIANKTVVTVSYVVTDEEDKVVGRTDPKRPVVALVGSNYLVPGLEKALMGREKGDEFTIKLQPAEAFGEFNPGLVQTIDRSLFGVFPVAEGHTFEADTSSGPRLVVVKEVREHEVVVDGNHPLAGKVLNFFVTVDDVREATEEEIAHGHAHRDGVCSFADPYGEEAEGEHHCCCGHHHHDGEEGEGGHHHCCGHHHHHDGEDGEGEHHCCGHHHHHHDGEEGEGEHHCCGHHHHHHDGEEGEGEHHCCCGRHKHEDNDDKAE